MRGKNNLFREAIQKKRLNNQSALIKSHCRLIDFLQQWKQDPSQKYTLYLGIHEKQNSIGSQQMNFSGGRSKEGMFDSWIKKQKDEDKNRQVFKEKDEEDFSLTLGKKQKTLQKKVDLKHQPCQIGTIQSKEYIQEYDNGRKNQNREKSPNNQSETEEKSNFFQSQKKSEKRKSPSQRKTPKVNARDFEKLILGTQNIHEQIADLAHRFVLEDKKNKQNYEEQLLISIEDQQKLALPKDQINQVLRKQEKNESIENESFVKAKMTFNMMPENEKSVGFSFAHNNEQSPEFPAKIPLLEISQGNGKIPQIQQIASERQYSQGNEQIQDLYSKWHKEEPINVESQHIKNIESMCYYNQKQRMNFQGNLMKFSKQSDSKPEITINLPNFNIETNPSTITVDIEEPNHEGQDYAQCLCLSQSPKKMRKEDSKINTPQELQIEFVEDEKEFQSVSKKQVPISASNSNKIFQSKSPPTSVRPQRDIYLSNAHSDSEGQKQQEVKPNTTYFEPLVEEEKKQKEAKRQPLKEILELKKQPLGTSIEAKKQRNSKKKSSPGPHFHNYGLNKVYSNGKKDDIQNKENTNKQVSDFQPEKMKQNQKQEKNHNKKLDNSQQRAINRSKERNTCRIVTYAKTTSFTAKNSIKESVTKKQDEQNVFKFDF